MPLVIRSTRAGRVMVKVLQESERQSTRSVTVEIWKSLTNRPLCAVSFQSIGVTVPVTSLAGADCNRYLYDNNCQADGVGTLALFRTPTRVTIDRKGTYALITDQDNCNIRRLDIASSNVTTLAGSQCDPIKESSTVDGVGTMAKFSVPYDIVIDQSGENALITDHNNARIRRLNLVSSNVTTLQLVRDNGNDFNNKNLHFQLNGLAIDPAGKYILLSDSLSFIWRHNAATKIISLFAGSNLGTSDGVGTFAGFSNPNGVAIHPSGTYALIADNDYGLIRRIDLTTTNVTTFAGAGERLSGSADGIGTYAKFQYPTAVTIDPSGTFALIGQDSLIRRIDLSTARVSTLAGSLNPCLPNFPCNADNIGTMANFIIPTGIAIDPTGSYAMIADSISGRIRRIELASPCFAGFYCPRGSSSPTPFACPAGSFCPAGSSSAAGGGLCAAGVNCPAGSKSSAGAGPCDAGFYCPAGAQAPLPCSAGYYCTAGSSSATQFPCAVGAFCPAGANMSVPCPEGFYCPDATRALPCASTKMCPAGTSSPPASLTALAIALIVVGALVVVGGVAWLLRERIIAALKSGRGGGNDDGGLDGQIDDKYQPLRERGASALGGV